MVRGLVGLLVGAVAGCELIANIPKATVVDPVDAMTDGGDDAMAAECMDNTACTQIGKQICDLTSNTCGGCVLDSECASNVCLVDGTCADPARFVYAAAGGSGDVCTVAQPCSVDVAVTKLTPQQDIVKLAPGVYTRAATLTMSIAGTIAGGGSTFTVAGAAGVFGIVANAVPIHIVGLTMSVAANNIAIRCMVAGGEIHLGRVTIDGANAAIYSTNCLVEIDRSTIRGAQFYGLYVNNAASVTVRNSYFVNIGTMPDYTIAALHMSNVASGTIEHTTIANNTALGPSGLRCPGSSGVTIRNIIAWGNVAPGVDAECVVANSIVDPGYTGGTANSSVNPMFMNPAMGDFHLMPGSPIAGMGTPAAMFGIDGDGDDRPQPAASNPDPGADEIP